jgi:anthranilate synthase
LYGAFSYDLAFQFEKLTQKHERGEGQRDIVLYIPDSMLIINQNQTQSWQFDYEFEVDGATCDLGGAHDAYSRQ